MKRRRIKKVDVKYVSLCKRGTAINRQSVVYKADDRSLSVEMLSKAADDFNERGEVLGLVYVPEVADAEGDFASKDAIRHMAHSFMRNGGKLDLQHDGKTIPSERAFVAETFIVAKGDERFHGWRDRAGNLVKAEDSWGMLVKLEDPELRRKFREGEWDGFSLYGENVEAEMVEAQDEALVAKAMRKLSEWFRGVPDPPEHKEIEMEPKDLKPLFDGLAEQIGKTVREAVSPLLPPSSDQVAAAKAVLAKAGLQVQEAGKTPTPNGGGCDGDGKLDLTKVADVRRRIAQLRLKKALEGIDAEDPEALEAYLQDLEAQEEEAKSARKASRARIGPGLLDNMSKAEQDALAVGDEMAKIMNAQQGWGDQSNGQPKSAGKLAMR